MIFLVTLGLNAAMPCVTLSIRDCTTKAGWPFGIVSPADGLGRIALGCGPRRVSIHAVTG